MSVMSVRAAAAWAIGSQYASFTIQFATSIVLARWFISPADLGLFSIAFAAVSLISFLQDFGVNRYIVGERDLTPAKIQTAFTISAAFALMVALLCIAAAWPIAWFYGDPRLLQVTQVIACSYLAIPLAVVPQAMCQRRMDYRSNTMIEVGAALANASVAIVLAMRGHGALALAWGAFAQQLARMAISQWRAGFMLPWPWRIKDAGPVFALGHTNTVLSICDSIVSRAPDLVIGRIINQAAVGLFTRASGLALQLRLLVAGAVTSVFFPAFRQVRDSGAPLGPPYLRVVSAYTGITWPAMAGIAMLAYPLIALLYGSRWIEAAPLLGWVALAQLCYVSVPINSDMAVLLNQTRTLLRLTWLDTAASLLLLGLAAPFGLKWVALSRVAHGLVWIAIYAPFMRRMLGLRWSELGLAYLQSGLATLAAITPISLSYLFWAAPMRAGLVQALLGAGLGMVCWLVALALLRHPLFAEITAMLTELRAALPRRSAAAPHR